MKLLWPLALSICAGLSAEAAADVVEISQKGRSFQPTTIDIHVGDTIRIHNDDEYTHNVYVKSSDFNFDSDEQAPGDLQEIKFTHVGTYEVLCHIHPKMKLVVHVQ